MSKGDQNLFSGMEFDKLKEFCKQCHEEDKKIYEKRKSQTYNFDLENEEPPKPQQPQTVKQVSYNQPQSINTNNNQESGVSSKEQEPISYNTALKINVLNENDPDPLHARIKFDTFDERVKQFGGGKK